MNLQQQILEYWHVSRIALAASDRVPSQYDRMLYVKKQLIANHSGTRILEGLNSKQIWFAIEDAVS